MALAPGTTQVKGGYRNVAAFSVSIVHQTAPYPIGGSTGLYAKGGGKPFYGQFVCQISERIKLVVK